MKRILITVMLTLTGCEHSQDSGYSHEACRQNIIEEFKTLDVAELHYNYTFIVRTPNGDVWYMEQMGSKPGTTLKTQLFQGK